MAGRPRTVAGRDRVPVKRMLPAPAAALIVAAGLSGCVTSTVDEMVFNEPIEGIGDATVVILGRRHASDYETEFDFIECIADHIVARDGSIEILDEIEFINSMYPWFEPRTAPLRPADIDKLMQQQPVAEQLANLKLEYMIWVDGSTVQTNSAGSMTCGGQTKQCDETHESAKGRYCRVGDDWWQCKGGQWIPPGKGK